MLKLAREPLLHFALTGIALFAITWAFRGPREAPGEPELRVHVSAGKIHQMTLAFTRTWRRPPSVEELEGLIEDHIREEVLAREAVAVGLDRDDLIIRRRLRQKMDVVLDDIARLGAPSERTLRDFLSANPDRFRKESRVAFRQVFLKRERAAAAASLLDRLRAGEDVEAGGDITLLPGHMPLTALSEIDSVFGPAFSRRLAEMAPGTWGGPLDSPYGAHLVFLSEVDPGGLPPFEEVRAEVRREWELRARREATEAAYRKLRERYAIEVERPGTSLP